MKIRNYYRLAFVVSMAYFMGCNSPKNEITLETELFPPSNLTIPVNQSKVAEYAFHGNRIYAVTFLPSCKLKLPEWCLSPTQDNILKGFPEARVVLGDFPAMGEKNGQSFKSSSQLIMSPKNVGNIYKELLKDTVVVIDMGKSKFAILPNHKYKLIGSVEKSETLKDDKEGDIYTVDYLTVNYLELIGKN